MSGGRLANRLPVTRSRTATYAPLANSAHPITVAMPLGPNESVSPSRRTVCELERNSMGDMLSGRVRAVLRHELVVETELSRPEPRESRVLPSEQRLPRA